ncbi:MULTISPECIES: hypothetical protein [Streptomyces]|uniref:hypothetical protein n=1 Tax=Streptomyces TaxID=1883 RepID=UPI00287F49B2|nr:hypothetical protein [Streptomyces sp. CGMCC 4.1456]WNF67242.1 hypothetical protein RJD14_33840 [Streptomyces sp. CGMCC 4.1456]
MSLHLALIAAPLLLAVLARLTRRQHGLADLARSLRDLITLRMVLRDTDPNERAELLRAHRAWRQPPTPASRRPAPRRGR